MDIIKYYGNPDEKPLDNIVDDGGFAAIFRTIGCIGDSLSSGEFETYDEEGIKLVKPSHSVADTIYKHLYKGDL